MEERSFQQKEITMEERSAWNKTNQWDEELILLKSIIAKTELVETKKWGGPVFTIDNKNVVGIGGFKSYVGIWFFNGVFMKDEANVLVTAQEGVTKSLRQWRFQSKAEILQNEQRILIYLNEAIGNERAGLSSKPQRKETVVSEFFQMQLDNDISLTKAFGNFSPFKQREFLEYIDTAKREETKIARMEKIKPMILDGIGLNDKYR